MKKTLFIAAAIVCVANLYSCKKNKITNSGVVGTWRVAWLAIDYNGNNSIDSDEINHYTTYPYYTIIFRFNSDGTGYDSAQNTFYNYTWNMSGDSLMIKYGNLAMSSSHIDQLDASSFQISGSNGTNTQWTKFVKQ